MRYTFAHPSVGQRRWYGHKFPPFGSPDARSKVIAPNPSRTGRGVACGVWSVALIFAVARMRMRARVCVSFSEFSFFFPERRLAYMTICMSPMFNSLCLCLKRNCIAVSRPTWIVAAYLVLGLGVVHGWELCGSDPCLFLAEVRLC